MFAIGQIQFLCPGFHNVTSWVAVEATCRYIRNDSQPSCPCDSHAAGELISASGLRFLCPGPEFSFVNLIHFQPSEIFTLDVFWFVQPAVSRLRHTCRNSIGLALKTTSKCVRSSILSKSHFMFLLVFRLSKVNQHRSAQFAKIWAGTPDRAYVYDTNPHAKSTYSLLGTN